MKRRVLVVLLALAMVLTYMPMAVYADTEAVSDQAAESEQPAEAVAEAIPEQTEPAEEAEELADDAGQMVIEEPSEEPAEEPYEEPSEEPAEEPAEEPGAIESPEKTVSNIDLLPINGDKTAGINSGELKSPPQNGWYKENGKWYYYESGGKYTGPAIFMIGEHKYWFDANGVLQTGWIKDTYTYDGETYTDWYYANSSGVLQEGWQKIDNKWYYFQPDEYWMYSYSGGYWVISGRPYWFSDKGVLQTGWIKDTYTYDGETYTDWYYANSSGVLQEGWQKIDNKWYYFEPKHYWMHTGRRDIEGKLYWFSDKGVLQTGWIKEDWGDGYVDWYYANSSGVLQDGWQKIGGKWYYFRPDSFWMYTGINWIDGNQYFFGDDGALASGWAKEIRNNPDYQLGPKATYTEWYYTNSKGIIQHGWKKIDNKWYYFDPEYGYMYIGGPQKIGEKYYYFTSGGVMQTGWIKEDWGNGYADWYYADSNGVLQSGWKKLGGKWYYFDPSNYYMYIGYYADLDGKPYYFDSNGVMVSIPKSGWVDEYGRWMYFENGKPVEGWKKIGGKWYYFHKYGSGYPFMYIGWRVIDGKEYVFDKNGVMISNPSGWVTDGDSWYYFKNGKALTGWQTISGKEYYFWEDGYPYMAAGYVGINSIYYYFNTSGVYEPNPKGWKQAYDSVWFYFKNGTPVTGWQKISGKWYLFDNDGWMITGWHQDNGKWYYFGDDGVMQTGKITIGSYTYNLGTSGAWDGK